MDAPVKMKVVYSGNGIMLGVAQSGDKKGYVYVGDASGNWTLTCHADRLQPHRGFVEVSLKKRRWQKMREQFKNVTRLRTST